MADGAQGDVPQRAAPAEEQVALLELGKGLLVRRAALGEASRIASLSRFAFARRYATTAFATNTPTV